MVEHSRTVVFDFDLTLTRWDTADRFFRWLLRRDAWRLALLGIALPVLLPLLLSRATRGRPIRFAVWVATLGRSDSDLQELVKAHLRAQHESAFVGVALQQLQQHLDQGDRVVIATGSLEPLARALLAQAGYAHVPLVASTLRPYLGGMARDQHCFGRNKVPMLAARGFSPPWSAAYTDHSCDLPVLQLSERCFVVSPTAQCLARIEQSLSAKPTVLAWR